MKKIKKLLMVLVTLMLATAMLSACSKTEDKEGADGDTNAETKVEASAAKITGSYLSPAIMSYSNMRPTYNYYLTTYQDQMLTTYEDGTYRLMVHSTQFSAIVLPEEGNDFSGNEKTNYYTEYYGTYTQTEDELDSDLLNITISKPTRIVDTYDSSYYVDTANWTEEMTAKTTELKAAQMKQYAQYAEEGEQVDTEVEDVTAQAYIDDKGFDELTFAATVSTSSIEYVELNPTEEAGE